MNNFKKSPYALHANYFGPSYENSRSTSASYSLEKLPYYSMEGRDKGKEKETSLFL